MTRTTILQQIPLATAAVILTACGNGPAARATNTSPTSPGAATTASTSAGTTASTTSTPSATATAVQTPDPKPSAAPDFSRMCATVTNEAGIPTCTQLYATKPYLRLPADPTSTGADKVILGGFNDAGRFVSAATGATYPMSMDASPVYSYAAKDNGWDNFIYRAVIRNAQVASVVKVAQVSENAALNRLFAGKTLEGRIDIWVPDTSNPEGGQWSGNTNSKATAPIRIQLDPRAQNGQLHGRIVNATQPIHSSNGACLPSLSSLGTRNPLFDGRTGSFELTRVTGMHNPGETMIVLTFSPGAGQGMATGAANHVGSIPLLLGYYNLIQIGDVANHADTRVDGPSWWGLHDVTRGGGRC